MTVTVESQSFLLNTYSFLGVEPAAVEPAGSGAERILGLI
jgi:hypothetical protein